MPTKHAFLSASGSYRWLNCTRQPTFAQELGTVRGETAYAREGTVAHAVAERWLHLIKLGFEQSYIEDCIRDEFKDNEFFNDDMLDNVRGYVGFILPSITDSANVWDFETEVSLDDYVPQGFGTVDFYSFDRISHTLRIVDLKYGQGVRVDAVSNSQLQLYALGMIKVIKRDVQDAIIDKVETVIYQPRINNISSDVYTIAELESFGKVVAEKAYKAFTGNGATLNAGDWCRFCGCKSRCRAYGEMMLKKGQDEFKSLDKLSDDELEDFLNRATELSTYVSTLKDELVEAIKSGYNSHGYTIKEVSGKKSMSENAAKMLDNLGIDPYERKLKSITQLKKEVGKDLFEKAVEGLLTVGATSYRLEKVKDIFKEVKDDES